MHQLAELDDSVRSQALEHFERLRPHLERGVPLPKLAREQHIPTRAPLRDLSIRISRRSSFRQRSRGIERTPAHANRHRRSGVRGEGLRRFDVTFPARVVTHATRQSFYFEREGLLRRLDYPAPHENDTQIAQMFSGHQRFSGVLVPTLCRLLNVGPDGVPVANRALLDLEIFDVYYA
jgi:hypothetical protein